MSVNLMGQPISTLRRWRPGLVTLDHRQMNQPLDLLDDMTRGVGVPRQVMPSVTGTPAVSVQLGTVLVAMDAGLTDDHLVCRAIDSDPLAYIPVLVAKPWLLRKTPWDGETRGEVRYAYDLEDSTKRTAYDVNDPPDTPEAERNKRNELISQQYLIGDELTVMPADTGIEIPGVDDEGLPITIPVNLIDTTSGRDWTVFFEQL